jgi:transcription elongation factor GreB
MSKAFTKGDDDGPPPVARARAPLPEGSPNYVTPRGFELLRAELGELQLELARLIDDTGEIEKRTERALLVERITELEARVHSADVIPRPDPAPEEARFGAEVTVSNEDGTERKYRVVGVDEADAERGLIAFTAPVARALMGKRVGDTVVVRTPRGEETLEIVEVRYST